VAEVLGLGRQLGRLPARLLALGIEGAEFGLGRPLTAAVALAADELVRDILQRTRSAR
jgi:Ni,Fe-hydrogenase maturation factor